MQLFKGARHLNKIQPTHNYQWQQYIGEAWINEIHRKYTCTILMVLSLSFPSTCFS